LEPSTATSESKRARSGCNPALLVLGPRRLLTRFSSAGDRNMVDPGFRSNWPAGEAENEKPHAFPAMTSSTSSRPIGSPGGVDDAVPPVRHFDPELRRGY
jgi:hypothetical protein